MAKDKGPWKDSVLRALAKRTVALPVDVTELTHQALLQKSRRLLLILVAVEFVALATLFAVAGIFPGFIDESIRAVEDDTELWLAAILLGLPVGTGLLVRWLISARIRRRPDEADHPWRFLATEQGLEVTSATDRRLAGPWFDWTYRGYLYLSVKGSRIPTALVVACQGTEIMVEFSRFRRRDAANLMRAVLQGLASVGHTDR